jgi:hypothetical protein
MGGSASTDKGSEDHEEGKGAEGQQKLSCTPTTGGRRRKHRRSHRTHRKRSHSKRHSRRR